MAGSAGQGAYEPQRLHLIDGLRGVAALLVIIYHQVHFFTAPGHVVAADFHTAAPFSEALGPVYLYGRYMVQLFWIISGFIFAHVYADAGSGTRNFFVNRLARLYPLHIVTLLAVTALNLVALRQIGFVPIYEDFDARHFILQLFMASNWADKRLSFNGPIWSVSAEIVIYAVFWAYLLWSGRLRLLHIGFACALFFVGFLLLRDKTWVFDCGLLFFFGCGLRVITRSWRSPGRIAVLSLALAVIGAAACVVIGERAMRSLGIAGMGGSAILLLYLAETHAWAVLRRAADWLGELSYGLYLWHFPLQLCAIILFTRLGLLHEMARSPVFLIAFLAVCMAVARISYRLIELPARRGMKAWLGARPAPAAG